MIEKQLIDKFENILLKKKQLINQEKSFLKEIKKLGLCIKNEKLTPKFLRICKFCSNEFYAKIHNAEQCKECQLDRSSLIECKCGCGKFVRKSSPTGYFVGCFSRGKNYKERFGDKKVNCGFKKGLENPNFTVEKKSLFHYNEVNSIGEKFRSKPEKEFSEFCLRNNIRYEYEKRLALFDNSVKIVDFILEGVIFLELSGYVYKEWQDDFNYKISKLRKSYFNPILILTYENKYDLIHKNTGPLGLDMFYYKFTNKNKLKNEKEFLLRLNSCIFLLQTNKMLFEKEKFLLKEEEKDPYTKWIEKLDLSNTKYILSENKKIL